MVAQPSAADAQDPPLPPLPPRHRVVYENQLGARINPLGAEEQLTLALRVRLGDDPRPLFRDAHVSIAATPTVSPAQARLGGTFEIKPLSVIALSAGLYHVSWFGTQGALQSYPRADADFSDSALKAAKERDEGYATSGLEAEVRGMVVAKVGHVAFRNEARFFRSQIDLRAGDRVFYTPRLDLLVPGSGWYMNNDTDLAIVSDFGLIAGIRTTVGHVFYRAGDGDSSANAPTVRTGPLLAYVLFDHPGALFNKPTVVAMANFWLAHRYRTGQDVSQAIPYIALAFRCEGEIWGG